MQLRAQFTGSVTNEPEVRHVGQNNTALKELNVAINHDKKNKETGEYERTGDTTWVRVSLWGERSALDFRKGDMVEFDGTLVEKTFQRKDGSEGRRLEADYIADLNVKFRKDSASGVADVGEPF
jgi:single-stranded DNA-binding protein